MQPQPVKRQAQRGYSIIELVNVMAIASAIAGTAIPSMGHMLDQQQLSSTTQDLVLAVNLARSEAITRGGHVTLAPLDHQHWNSGWRIFADENGNGAFEGDETAVRVFPAPPSNMKVDAKFGIYHGRALNFDSSGRLRRANGSGMVLGHITLEKGSAVRTLCFSKGTMRVVKSSECEQRS